MTTEEEKLLALDQVGEQHDLAVIKRICAINNLNMQIYNVVRREKTLTFTVQISV